MSTLLNTFASYLPTLILQRLQADAKPLASPAQYTLRGTGLFADISGFTTLTERLAVRGSSGVEELSRMLNLSFSQMLELIEQHGGDVLKFAGDALLAFWPDDDEHATLRAAQCALAIHRRLHTFYQLIESDRLQLRIGIATGEITALQVGGIYGRWELLVTGEPLLKMGKAERLARPGEVVLTPKAWEQIADRSNGTPVGGTSEQPFMRLKHIHTPIPLVASQPPKLTPKMNTALRSFIPGAVLSRLVAGETSWLAELRRITVLFVNLPSVSHTTELAQAQQVVHTLQSVLYRYEGSVNKITIDDKGITLVAALGLPPLAHEDDALRGVQVALGIAQALREMGHANAIGITSGQAFCGEIGSSYRREYTMIGDIVNVAARLMQSAKELQSAPDWQHGTILCDEATYQQSQSRITFRALEPISLKGKQQLVRVYQPLSEIPNAERSRHTRHQGTLIGRIHEQNLLAEQIHTMLRGQPGGTVLIEGEAGIGKSVLVERVRQLSADLQLKTLFGTGDATEQSTPYHPWRTVFHQIIEPHTTEALDQRLVQWLGPDVAALTPLLNVVLPLDLPDTPQTKQLQGQRRAAATRDLLIRLLQHDVEQQPHLLILEDAHWFDSASWELAVAISQRVQPMLMLITLRPPSTPSQPEYRYLLSHALLRLQLDILAPEEAITLVCQRLGVNSLPKAVADLIHDKAHGHPFFSEELAYALRDAGLIEISNGECHLSPTADLNALTFPDTVQGAIISRIDRLTPTQQLTLKVASVIGRVFPMRTLRAIYPIATNPSDLHADLNTLAQLNITPIEAAEPELAYIFKHAITQDVVYNLMLFAQRRQLHRAIAEWYELAFGSAEQEPTSDSIREPAQPPQHLTNHLKLEPYYPLLAHHWGKAGVTSKAITYLEKAGRYALTISAVHEARAAFEQALQLLEDVSDGSEKQHQQATLLQLLGEAEYQSGAFGRAEECFEASLTLMRTLNDTSGMINALNQLGRIATDTGSYRNAQQHLQAALELAHDLGDRAHTAQVLANLGHMSMSEGNFERSEAYFQESLVLFAALGDLAGTAQVFNGMGNSAVDRHMYDVARYCYEESLALRTSISDRLGIGSCLSNLGWVAHLQHDFNAARTYYQESLTISRTIGDLRGTAIVLNNLGFTYCELHEYEEAAASFDEALQITKDIGAIPLSLEVLIGKARLLASAEQPVAAAELLGLAKHHPASNSDITIQAELFERQLKMMLPPEQLAEALARGAQLDLETVVADMLNAMSF